MKVLNYIAAVIFLLCGCMLDGSAWHIALGGCVITGLWLIAAGVKGGYLIE